METWWGAAPPFSHHTLSSHSLDLSSQPLMLEWLKRCFWPFQNGVVQTWGRQARTNPQHCEPGPRTESAPDPQREPAGSGKSC